MISCVARLPKRSTKQWKKHHRRGDSSGLAIVVEHEDREDFAVARQDRLSNVVQAAPEARHAHQGLQLFWVRADVAPRLLEGAFPKP